LDNRIIDIYNNEIILRIKGWCPLFFYILINKIY
jgi:spore coat polysaccharide biosynthesis protein SpsF (cytidylyltransferase family)